MKKTFITIATTIAAGVIYSYIPPNWMPVLAAVLAGALGVSEALAKTNKIQANGWLDLVTGLILKLQGRIAPQFQPVPQAESVAEKTFQAIKQQEPVSVSDDTPDDPTGVSPKG